MKAYLTTIGEPTTEICKEQLERFGFDVVVLDGAEPWAQKYARFIETADEDCIRIDADVILNQNIKEAINGLKYQPQMLMVQWSCYDLYRNNIGVCSPVFYSKKALEIIREDFKDLDLRRPEATAWRLKRINEFTATKDWVVGMHGFFQDKDHLARHLENKIERKQMEDYDFELAKKLTKLYGQITNI